MSPTGEIIPRRRFPATSAAALGLAPMVCLRSKLEASDREMPRNLPADFETKPPGRYRNSIGCVRSRMPTVAASFGQLAIVARDPKQPVKCEPKTEKVLDNAGKAEHPRLGARLKAA